MRNQLAAEQSEKRSLVVKVKGKKEDHLEVIFGFNSFPIVMHLVTKEDIIELITFTDINCLLFTEIPPQLWNWVRSKNHQAFQGGRLPVLLCGRSNNQRWSFATGTAADEPLYPELHLGTLQQRWCKDSRRRMVSVQHNYQSSHSRRHILKSAMLSLVMSYLLFVIKMTIDIGLDASQPMIHKYIYKFLTDAILQFLQGGCIKHSKQTRPFHQPQHKYRHHMPEEGMPSWRAAKTLLCGRTESEAKWRIVLQLWWETGLCY